MNTMFQKFLMILPMILLPAKEYAQGSARYKNCLYWEYGIIRYNNSGSGWLDNSGNLLSFGLGYNRELLDFLVLGLKGKYYQQAMQPGSVTLSSNSAQVQVRLQRPQFSRTFRLRRVIPYIETGIGYATEFPGNNTAQRSAEYTYMPLLAGIDYRMGRHWSLGIHGEYRLSGRNARTVSDDVRSALNRFNTAALRLGFYFGVKSKRSSVPLVYTRPAAEGSVPHKIIPLPVPPAADRAFSEHRTSTAKQQPAIVLAQQTVQLSDSNITTPLLPEMEKQGAAMAVIKSRADTLVLFHRDTVFVREKEDPAGQGRDTLVPSTREPTGGKSSTPVAIAADTPERSVHIAAYSQAVNDSNRQQLQEQLSRLAAENTALHNRLVQVEVELHKQEANRHYAARDSVLDGWPARPVNLVPETQPVSKTNTVVIPLPLPAGAKKDTDKLRAEHSVWDTKRQDSLFARLADIQAKLELLREQQAVSPMKVDQPGPLSKTFTDSVRKDFQQRLRRLQEENRSLQEQISAGSSTPSGAGLLPGQAAGGDVFFGLNQFKLDTGYIRQLSALADTMRSGATQWVLLEGFTDASGSAAYNLQLSEKRVRSVRAFLLQKGIPKERILEKYSAAASPAG